MTGLYLRALDGGPELDPGEVVLLWDDGEHRILRRCVDGWYEIERDRSSTKPKLRATLRNYELQALRDPMETRP